jgi:hypothetical protein
VRARGAGAIASPPSPLPSCKQPTWFATILTCPPPTLTPTNPSLYSLCCCCACRYGLFYTYLDLDHLEGTFQGMWPLASHSRLALDGRPPTRWTLSLAHFWEGDHLKDVPVETEPATGRPLHLAERVRRLVQRATGARPEGRICLLTHLRYLGYVFNPVSFYYVWDKEVRAYVRACVHAARHRSLRVNAAGQGQGQARPIHPSRALG